MIEGIKKWWHMRCVNSQLSRFVNNVKLTIGQARLNKAYAEHDIIRGRYDGTYKKERAEKAIKQGEQILEWVRLLRVALEPTVSEGQCISAKEALRQHACELAGLMRNFEMSFDNFSKARHEILNMFLQYEKERNIK